MSGLRLLTGENVAPQAACCRCRATGCPWDRIAGRPYCPDCQESLAMGEAEPLVERVEPQRCAICQQTGTLRYLTFPLHASAPLEIDLCRNHFRSLLARRLSMHAFQQLRRQLEALALTADRLFLLHEAFYEAQGRALQPVPEVR